MYIIVIYRRRQLFVDMPVGGMDLEPRSPGNICGQSRATNVSYSGRIPNVARTAPGPIGDSRLKGSSPGLRTSSSAT
jgi:hypothetical protein